MSFLNMTPKVRPTLAFIHGRLSNNWGDGFVPQEALVLVCKIHYQVEIKCISQGLGGTGNISHKNRVDRNVHSIKCYRDCRKVVHRP